ncbi:Uncharacterised protein [uncultured archaeon]|nr:Uncharacterised protein [uncultured archaeon]
MNLVVLDSDLYQLELVEKGGICFRKLWQINLRRQKPVRYRYRRVEKIEDLIQSKEGLP